MAEFFISCIAYPSKVIVNMGKYIVHTVAGIIIWDENKMFLCPFVIRQWIIFAFFGMDIIVLEISCGQL